MDPKPEVLRARACSSCKQKRQVIQWEETTSWGYVRKEFALCAPCLLQALSSIIGTNLHRKKKGGKKT